MALEVLSCPACQEPMGRYRALGGVLELLCHNRKCRRRVTFMASRGRIEVLKVDRRLRRVNNRSQTPV
jgi:hypothetical protein